MALLDAFEAGDRVLSLAELTRRTGLTKATAHRLTRELVAHRLLDREEGGYRLSSGLFERGLRALADRGLVEIAMPFLQDLYALTRETVHLGVLDADEVVYIAKIVGHRQIEVPSRLGGRMPLHCTAIGKALLAHADADLRQRVLSAPLPRRTPHTIVVPGLLAPQLETAAANGVAFEREESAAGVTCVAAPVLARDGRPLAAVSVTGPMLRLRPEAHASAVRAAAGAIAAILERENVVRSDPDGA